MDKSVETAIEKHPRLVRYFVCIPLDRSDARVEGQRSAKDKWEDHLEKWTKQAAEKGISVEFVYWGSSELLERLARSEHVGRVRFWFDVLGFDPPWFSARLDEALRKAGPRYTPDVHLDLPIARELEAFGRTDRFFDREKAHARTIREKLRSFEYPVEVADATVDQAAATVSAKVRTVLNSMSAITAEPTGPLTFSVIAEQIREAEDVAEELSGLLDERGLVFEATRNPSESRAQRPYSRNPFRDQGSRLFSLISELGTTRESLAHAGAIAGSALMIVRGVAGTGKTHLLCDVARQRVDAGRPTVLLMGQQFVSHEVPWTQALQQLDLANFSAQEFVGALEAAGQAAGARALLVIDAINEGAGRTIWPSQLAAFVAHAERSPWIGVVLSVRSSYEGLIVPAEVGARAVAVTHRGFTDHEYDATKAFFIHYGLELPSTPLLAPEFRNPLFLKTLCQGLKAKGERRLPRGFQGITAVFDLYLSAVNARLASSLGFDARIPLVRRAVEYFARACVDSRENWLTLAKAAEIVNVVLPGRDFERSLYRGLVVEGVLVEEAKRRGGVDAEEIVFVVYERLADHLAAKSLLDCYLDGRDPASAFVQGGPLAFICDEGEYVSRGLLEAFCIQVPERIGQELISIAPACGASWGFGDAFRQSLVWRAHSAVCDGTRDALDKLSRSENDLFETLDVLLTVATLPGHSLNAHFLDVQLRKASMPDRDAWWSVYLHRAFGTHCAVDRMVDWASSQDAHAAFDDESIDLCAVALAWMLTTSNRFLRDRATKALVSLLTGRLAAVTRLVDRFADADDPYVVERVYAVAYAVAMRSNDPVAVGALATSVYNHVFGLGSPYPHILLRDYARGVVERALHLGSAIDVVPDRVRPPYKSTWPTIPTAEDIKPLLPDWSKGSYDSRELEWGWNRIANSVMTDDFARYVIGTNSSSTSSHWLALTLDDEAWKPAPSPEDRLRSLVGEFSDEERLAWGRFEAADEAHAADSQWFVPDWLAQAENEAPASPDLETLVRELEAMRPPEMVKLEAERKAAVAALEAVLTRERSQLLQEIWSVGETDYEALQPPRLDLRQIQRYILRRVCDLGWTKERFGRFDRFSIGHNGREASKAERIGKKYQWIAYHEIMALISDRFQYREQFRGEGGDGAYEGPWQDHLRDIDPSCTVRSLRGGAFGGHLAAAWWKFARYDTWGDSSNPRDWVLACEDLPRVEDLLLVTNPVDGSRWLNGQGYFNWEQEPPVDRESSDVERRELWYNCTGYLVRADDGEAFLKWAEGVDFWGRWMPDAPEVYRMFLGEHAWAPASRYFQTEYYGDDGWVQPDHGCPSKIRTLAFNYLCEASSFDCSVDEGFSLQLPASDVVAALGIRWSGRGADFVDAGGRLAAQDLPPASTGGPSALLLREDLLREFLAREKLTICWAVLGEKRVLWPGVESDLRHPALRLSGAYLFSEGRVRGFVKRMLDDPNCESPEGSSGRLDVVSVARTEA